MTKEVDGLFKSIDKAGKQAVTVAKKLPGGIEDLVSQIAKLADAIPTPATVKKLLQKGMDEEVNMAPLWQGLPKKIIKKSSWKMAKSRSSF